MTTFPVSGGCLCGSVRYTVSEPANCVVHCHCSLCRRSYGSLVGTGAIVERKYMKIEKGETNLTTYATPPEIQRRFCRTCGCSLFYYLDELPEKIFYYPATLDGGVHPGHPEGAEHHIHVGSKVTWEHFEDALPNYIEDMEIDVYKRTRAEWEEACRVETQK